MMSNEIHNKQKDLFFEIKTHYKIEQDFNEHFWNYHRTESTDYQVLDVLFNHLAINQDDRLVDLGCGTGRVLIYSAYRLEIPVIGIEYLKTSFDIACDNIVSFRKKFGEYDLTILNQQVENYQISEFDTIFYFFNPFNIQIMRIVIYHILDSLNQFPRNIKLVIYYPLDICVKFIMEKTDFILLEEIKLDGHHKDPQERILIFQN